MCHDLSNCMRCITSEKSHAAGNNRSGKDCTSDCQTSCPDGWEPFEGKCYLWTTNRKATWANAETFCRGERGHLASITTNEVNKYMLNRVGANKVWIGANDRKTEGTWEWTDCSPFNFEGWVHPPTLLRKDNCAELYNTNEDERGWNDLECHMPLDFVCARPICPGTKQSRLLVISKANLFR